MPAEHPPAAEPLGLRRPYVLLAERVEHARAHDADHEPVHAGRQHGHRQHQMLDRVDEGSEVPGQQAVDGQQAGDVRRRRHGGVEAAAERQPAELGVEQQLQQQRHPEHRQREPGDRGQPPGRVRARPPPVRGHRAGDDREHEPGHQRIARELDRGGQERRDVGAHVPAGDEREPQVAVQEIAQVVPVLDDERIVQAVEAGEVGDLGRAGLRAGQQPGRVAGHHPGQEERHQRDAPQDEHHEREAPRDEHAHGPAPPVFRPGWLRRAARQRVEIVRFHVDRVRDVALHVSPQVARVDDLPEREPRRVLAPHDRLRLAPHGRQLRRVRLGEPLVDRVVHRAVHVVAAVEQILLRRRGLGQDGEAEVRRAVVLGPPEPPRHVGPLRHRLGGGDVGDERRVGLLDQVQLQPDLLQLVLEHQPRLLAVAGVELVGELGARLDPGLLQQGLGLGHVQGRLVGPGRRVQHEVGQDAVRGVECPLHHRGHELVAGEQQVDRLPGQWVGERPVVGEHDVLHPQHLLAPDEDPGRAPQRLGVLRVRREGDVEVARLHPLAAVGVLRHLADDDLVEVRPAPAAPVVRVAHQDDLVVGLRALDHVGAGPGGVRLQVVVPVVGSLLLHVRVHDAGAVLRGEQQVEPRHGDAEVDHDRARVLDDDLLARVGDVGGQGRAGPELRRDGAGVGGLEGVAVERRPVAVLDPGPQRERPHALVGVRRYLLGEPRLGLGGAAPRHAHQRVVGPEVRHDVRQQEVRGRVEVGHERVHRHHEGAGIAVQRGSRSARRRRRGGRRAPARGEQAGRRADRHRAGGRPGGSRG